MMWVDIGLKILGAITLFGTLIVFFAALAGRVLGFSNARCFSPQSDEQQGRLRLDDCNDERCARLGQCKYISKEPR